MGTRTIYGRLFYVGRRVLVSVGVVSLLASVMVLSVSGLGAKAAWADPPSGSSSDGGGSTITVNPTSDSGPTLPPGTGSIYSTSTTWEGTPSQCQGTCATQPPSPSTGNDYSAQPGTPSNSFASFCATTGAAIEATQSTSSWQAFLTWVATAPQSLFSSGSSLAFYVANLVALLELCGLPTSPSPGGTLPLGYGVGTSTSEICIDQWIYTYDGQTLTEPPVGCDGRTGLKIPVECDGRSHTLYVSYTLKLVNGPPPPVFDHGVEVPEPPFNPGPYGPYPATVTPACSSGANSEPSQTTWTADGPDMWPANGSAAQVDFYPHATGGFGYVPTWNGFSSYQITNYPSNTWHITPVTGKSALNVNLYQASEAPGPGSLGPYHVTATGSYTIVWGTQYEYVSQGDSCVLSTTTVWTQWSYRYTIYESVNGKTIPVTLTRTVWDPHIQFNVNCGKGPVQVVTYNEYHTRVDTVSASWDIAGVVPTVSH